MDNRKLLTKEIILNSKYGLSSPLIKLITVPVVACLTIVTLNRGQSGLLIGGIFIATLIISSITLLIKSAKKNKQMKNGTNDFIIKTERLENKSRASIFSSRYYYFEFNSGKVKTDLSTYSYARLGDEFFIIINPKDGKILAVFNLNNYVLADELQPYIYVDNSDPTIFKVD